MRVMSAESPSKSDALARADAAWEGWRSFLARESEAGRTGLKGADGWTLAEAVAHIARWQAWAAERLRSLPAGGRTPRLEIDVQNAEWAESDRGVEFEVARGRLEDAWKRLHAEAQNIPEAKWRRLVSGTFAANTWEHYQEHLDWHPPEGAHSPR